MAISNDVRRRVDGACPALARANLGTAVQTAQTDLDAAEVRLAALDTAVTGAVPVLEGRVDALDDPATGRVSLLDTAVTGAVPVLQAAVAALTTSRVALSMANAPDIVASIGATNWFIAGAAGTIPSAGFTLGETGADGTDALSLEMDVLINGVTIFTTKPKLLGGIGAAAAADGATTFVAGTGVTVGVVDAAANIVAPGDIITYSFTLTRTTPEDEMAELFGVAELAY